MTIKLTRPSQESVSAVTDKLGVVLVFQQLGTHDHRIVGNILKEYFGEEPVADIHYEHKMAAVFIFKSDKDVLSKKELNDIRSRVTDRRKFAIVQPNGSVAKGSTLQMIQVSSAKNKITVNQKFVVLLTLEVDPSIS